MPSTPGVQTGQMRGYRAHTAFWDNSEDYMNQEIERLWESET